MPADACRLSDPSGSEYSTGRKLVAGDFKTFEAILNQAAKDDFHRKDLIVQIAVSDLMRIR